MPTSIDDIQATRNRPVEQLRIDRPVFTERELNDWIGRPECTDPPAFRAQLKAACIHTAKCLAPECLKKNQRRKKSPDETDDEKTSGKKRRRCMNGIQLCGAWLISFLPFIGILRKYDLKNWFLNDLVAGLTVGIMHVPQGMAYAMLATLPPVYGLYTSFFPPLVYFFFGTSRHISIGTIAVVSLLTGEFLDKIVQQQMGQNALTLHSNVNRSMESTTNALSMNETVNPIDIRIMYAPSLAMCVGLSQILMGVLRIGGVIRYLSGPMTSGFTVGVAVHVLTSQVTTLLGVSIAKPVGLFAIPKTYYEIFRVIHRSNPVTIGLSASCILILVVFKTWINPPVAKRIKVPIPIDLVIVIVATVTSHFLDLNNSYHVKVVGHVSKGIRSPILPHLDKMQDAIGDIVVLTIVSFSVTVSLTRIFAKTFDYKVDCNQELYAYGLSNVISSFFQAYPSAGSLSRSAVQVSAGGKTQVATLFSSVLLILVLFFIGPLFYTVPNCCLSAIIVVALKGMFVQASELKPLWKYSIWDFAIWLFTFLSTIVLDVKFGLLCGIVFSAMTVILRTQSPPVRLLGQVDGTELYRDVRQNTGGKCFQSGAIKVVRYEGSIYYACAEQFRQAVYRQVGLNPSYVFSRMQKIRRRLSRVETALGLVSDGDGFNTTGSILVDDPLVVNNSNKREEFQLTTVVKSNGNTYQERVPFSSTEITVAKAMNSNSETMLERRRAKLSKQLKQLMDKCSLQFVVLDCSCWTFVDFVGAEELKQVFAEFRRIGVSVLLAQLTDHISCVLLQNNKLPDGVEVFPTIHDAILWALSQIESETMHLQTVNDLVNSFDKCKTAMSNLLSNNPPPPPPPDYAFDDEDDDEEDEEGLAEEDGDKEHHDVRQTNNNLVSTRQL